MINWFGLRAWDAPVCAEAPRCDIPVGTNCGRCGQPIGATDSGVTLPGSDGRVAFHFACHLKMILPHTLWPSTGLVPDDSDGITIDGRFECKTCGMVYQRGMGWMQRLI